MKIIALKTKAEILQAIKFLEYQEHQEPIRPTSAKTRYLHFNYKTDSELETLLKKISERIYLDLYKDSNDRIDHKTKKLFYIEQILNNCLFSFSRKKFLKYSRDKNAYKFNLSKNNKKISTKYDGAIAIKGHSYSYITEIIDYFEKIGFLKQQRGSQYIGLLTLLYPGRRFWNLLSIIKNINAITDNSEVIKLKAVVSTGTKKTKAFIEYKDNAFTKQKRINLKAINKHIQGYIYSLDTDTMKNKGYQESVINAIVARFESGSDKLNLVRTFSDSKFNLGGRFYKGQWQSGCYLKKEHRPFILIDNQKTIELDYKSLHPSILYSLTGLQTPDDIYSIPGFSSLNRKIIKLALLTMINSRTEISCIRSISYELLHKDRTGDSLFTSEIPDGNHIHIRTLLNAIAEKHKAISQYFYSGIGTSLQFHDSELVEQILLKLVSLNVPGLPVHDSVISTESNREILKNVMESEYFKKFGFKITVE